MPRDDSNQSHGILAKFLHLAGAQWLRDALNSLFLIYLARTNSTTYGEFMISFGLAYIILFLGEFGLNQPLVTALSKKFSNKGDLLLQYSIIKGSLLLAGWIGVFGFIWLQGYSAQLQVLCMSICLGVGLEAMASSFFMACQVQGRQDQEAKVRAVSTLVAYGYGLSMLFFGAPMVLVALFKFIENACNLAGGVSMAMKWPDLKNLTLQRKAIGRTWGTAKNGLVFVLMAMSAIIYNKANLFFLQRFGGPEQVAQYSVTWELVDGASNLASSLLLRGVLYPLFVKLWRQSKEEYTRLAQDSAKWLLGVAMAVMFILFIESDRIIFLVYGKAYFQAGIMQRYLCMTVICAVMTNLAAYLLLSQELQNTLTLIHVGGFVLNLILCGLLIPNDPLLGAVLAMVVTKIAVMVTVCIVGHRRSQFLNWKKLSPLALAAALGAVAYFALAPLGVREIAETGAIIPLAVVLWRWWKVRQNIPAAGTA